MLCPERKPSQHLNNNAALMGLSYQDVSLLGINLMILLMVFRRFQEPRLTYLALFLTFLLGVVLVPLRLKYRRKILRDRISFILRERVIYDPRSHRSFR